jgi:HAD superfamily hydrolase (TIGR01509 family)
MSVSAAGKPIEDSDPRRRTDEEVVLRAIVLDFDGVIANSEPLHFRAFRDVLADRGLDLAEHDYYTRYLGYDDLGAFRAIAADRGRTWSAADLAGLMTRKAARMEALERDASVLFPGAAAAIRRAAAAVPLAIASGALGAEIRRVLDGADLTRYFAAIVAAEDTTAGKPAPDPYRRAVALLSSAMSDAGLSAADCVAIEDSRWGIASARAAGLRTVGVTSSFDAGELSEADLIIGSLGDLDLANLQRLLF